MEDRKLVMLAAEEERKQRILNERKQFHREATERFRQATERCKIGPGAEHAITMFPPSGISIGTTTGKGHYYSFCCCCCCFYLQLNAFLQLTFNR